MRRFLVSVLSVALCVMMSLSVFTVLAEESAKSVVFVNRTGFSIAELYAVPETEAAWGACLNSKWIKADEEIELTFSGKDIAQGSEWKFRIGLYRAGSVKFLNFNHIDLAPFFETGFASFMPDPEKEGAVTLAASKKEFFHFSNTTEYTISSLALMPSGTTAGKENRLEKPLLPGETIVVRMGYDEVMLESEWNLRLGIDKDGKITYFTLQNFPLEKLTGCECVVLKPYKDSCSFYYSQEPVE